MFWVALDAKRSVNVGTAKRCTVEDDGSIRLDFPDGPETYSGDDAKAIRKAIKQAEKAWRDPPRTPPSGPATMG